MSKHINFIESLIELTGVFDFGIKLNASLKIIMCLIILITFWVSGIFQLINIRNDFDSFAEVLSLLLVGFTGFNKYFTFIFNRKKMKNLMNVVKWDEISRDLVKLKSDEHSIIDNYNQDGLKFSKIYAFVICVFCQGLILQPLPDIFLGRSYQLPFASKYPFSLNSTRMFTTAYIHQSIATYIFLLIYIAFDTWFIFLIHHACGHFSLLKYLLKKIGDTQDKTDEKIIGCVKVHQNIYKFSMQIEDVFNIHNLIQFLVSTVAICVSGYEIVCTGFNSPPILVKHICSVCGQIIQLFIMNWCGQLMEEKSFEISEAISKSNFYKLEIYHQRDLVLVLLRAQKPAYITAGKFSNLSLPNFTNLMQGSMSYFAMLTSVQNNENI